MNFEKFHQFLLKQYESKLPFVVFKPPNTNICKAYLQPNCLVNKLENYSEKGFIFAPFNTDDDTVVFLQENCKIISSSIESKSKIIPKKKFLSNDKLYKKEHLFLIEKALKVINDSSLEKVVLSRQLKIEYQHTFPLELFYRLSAMYIEAYTYCWFHPKIGLWLGASPESFLELQGKSFNTMALAGTKVLDCKEASNWDFKNHKEQALVTDYLTDVLEPLCDSLHIGPTKSLKAGHLTHLKTDIHGTLKPGVNNLSMLLHSLHPTPAVCGTPKTQAFKFILQNELNDREFYSGYLGEFNSFESAQNKTMLVVNLRCMQLRDNYAILYSGGGITKYSNPEDEWVETQNKMQTILRAL